MRDSWSRPPWPAYIIYERLACSRGSQCLRLGAFESEGAVVWCVLMPRSPSLESTGRDHTASQGPEAPYGHSAHYSAMTTYISENFRFPTLNVLSRLSRTSPVLIHPDVNASHLRPFRQVCSQPQRFELALVLNPRRTRPFIEDLHRCKFRRSSS
jgi:hypothetical protein